MPAVPAVLAPLIAFLSKPWVLPAIFGAQAVGKGVTSSYLTGKQLDIQKAMESMRIKSEAERMKMAREDRREAMEAIRKIQRERSSKEREAMLMQMAEMGRMQQMNMMNNLVASMTQASPTRGYQPMSPLSIPGLLSE